MLRRLLLLSLALLPFASGYAQPAVPSWLGPESIGQINEPQINEASGLAASSRETGLFWINNDSGGQPMLYAVDSSGEYRGSLRIEGAGNRDWEDVASFQIDGRTYLLIADTGDNNARYPDCVLYIIEEPEPAALSPEHELSAVPAYTLRFVYPDGPRDCESVAVDAGERAIYLISKRTKPPVAYRLPLFPDTHDLVAERIGPINGIPEPSGLLALMSVPWGKWRAQPCSLDISRDGRRAAVLTYGEVYLYERRDGESWAAAFAREGQALPAHNLPQAEALCFAPDGSSLYVTTEGLPAPLLRYRINQLPASEAQAANPQPGQRADERVAQ